jgi:hypothetical protein
MKRLLSLLICAIAFLPSGAQNKIARISPGAPGWVTRGIEAAYKTGAKKAIIPAGTYVIEPSDGRNIELTNLRDFEIDATGVTFVFTDSTDASVVLKNCRSTTLRGLTVRQAVLPFTQGTIESIADDGMSYDIRLDRGYPQLDDPGRFDDEVVAYPFDPETRVWKRGAQDVNAHFSRIGPVRFRLQMKWPSRPSASQSVAVGDLIGIRGRGSDGVEILNSSQVQLSNVTVLSAGSFAFFEGDGDGDNRYTVTVKRGPRPDGATAEPLFSSTADGFHSANVRKGPTLEHCYFESMPDDGIAIHGSYSLVLQGGNDTLVINRNHFRAGDPLRLIDLRGVIVAEAVVTKVTPLPHFQTAMRSVRVVGSAIMDGPYVELKLDRVLPAKFDFLVGNPNALGSGYVLRNNIVRNHRARGMLLKADDGLIEGNTVDGSSMGGIVVTPEFWWMEAGYSRNLILRGNTIRRTSYYPQQAAGLLIGALAPERHKEVEPGFALQPGGSQPGVERADNIAPGRGHQHILIEDNTFEEIDEVNILVTSAKDVTIRHNSFVRPFQREKLDGDRTFGADPGTLLWFSQCEDVHLVGNLVDAPGPYLKALTVAGPSAQVSGLKDGVNVANEQKH